MEKSVRVTVEEIGGVCHADMKPGDSFIVKDKLFVDNSGRVIFVEQLISSGSLEVDALARKYLKKWRFCALGRPEDKDFQWGVVTVRLDSLNDSD